jgi:uncharacterized DUF497 family protein
MYNRAYNGVVDMLQYEWDAHKAQTNYEKHKIAFADAVSAFGDDYAITIVDDHPEESRYILLGQDSQNRMSASASSRLERPHKPKLINI